jgi:dTDP-glucose pyrophosphorylase
MAGRGSRFQKAGYTLPKPLIPVHGKPMISLVIGNLRPRVPHRFIFLVLSDHIEQYQIDQQLRQWVPDCEVVVVDQVTEGAACTVLLAKAFISNDQPLMIANSDQWVDCDINAYLNHMEAELADGLIMTMTADDPKWSFVKFDSQGQVVAVVEKQVVSREATVGIYNYRRGRDFVAAAESMIAREFRVNGEFYVAPAYDEMVARGMKLVCYNIGSEAQGMYGLGIPADLDLFLTLPVSQKAVAEAV